MVDNSKNLDGTLLNPIMTLEDIEIKLEQLGFDDKFINYYAPLLHSKSLYLRSDSLLEDIFSRHQAPIDIVTDMGANFNLNINSFLNLELSHEDLVRLLKRSKYLENISDELILRAIEFSELNDQVPLYVNDFQKVFYLIPSVYEDFKYNYWLNTILNDVNDEYLVPLYPSKDHESEKMEAKLESGLIAANNGTQPKQTHKHCRHFIAGGLSGALSRTMTAPLERLKILYQVNYAGRGLKPPNMLAGLRQVLINDGFTGLFRGNTISLLKSTPDTAIKFYTFEKCKYYLQSKYGEKLSPLKLFAAGAISGVAGNITIFPLDVIKTRLSAAPKGTYCGIIDTAHKIYKEGGFRTFYKGVEASICCTLPNSGLNLSFYELLKRVFSGSTASDNASLLTTPKLMFIGGLSAMFSSTILYPFQTIQSRLIMSGLNAAQIGHSHIVLEKQKINMLTVIRQTLALEGSRGFFKGYCPGITKIIIGNSLGFCLYEKIKPLVTC